MTHFDGVTEFSQIFTSDFYIFTFTAAFLNTVFALIIARKFMQILQSVGYVKSEYAKWTYRRDNIYITRLFMVAMLSVMAYFLFCVGFSYTDDPWNTYVAFIFYIAFLVIYVHFDFKRKSKARLVLTARTVRLCVTFFVTYFIFTVMVVCVMHILGYLFKNNQFFLDVRFSVLCITPLMIPILTAFANAINSPLENANNKKYIERTKKILQDHPELIKIGLTGSYGKTSVKEILRTILSVKFKVLATPASYNTPMGISKTVKHYDGTEDIFIAEMGARRVGEIKELAEIVKPDYAIITGIGNQHLETFGSLDAVLNTKYELVESLPESGTAVFMVDSKNTSSLFERARHNGKVKAVAAGTDADVATDVFCSDIVTRTTGSSFTLNFGDEKISAETVLVGKHNVSNIAVAAALAYELGLTKEETAEGISLIKPIRHRLEVSSGANGITIIDDSYNSNVDGTVAALEVFSSFDGRKIIITPGLVELGKMQDVENFRFGRRIAAVADFAFLVGGPNAYKIRDGMLDSGFPLEKIKICPDLQDAVKKMKEISATGDVVLFENDLPDKYL